MAIRTVVGGAASAWTTDRVQAPLRTGTIIHSGHDALYINDNDNVIGIVSRYGISIPCTISTRLGTLADLDPSGDLVSIGTEVHIGAGRILVADTDITIGRILDFRLQRLTADQLPAMKTLLAEHTGKTSQQNEVSASVIEALIADPASIAGSLLGLGSGLTPFGDDVLCGMIAVLDAARSDSLPALHEVVTSQSRTRTTALSATLLRAALAGEVVGPFANLISKLTTQPEHVSSAIADLTSIGHTSGIGMLLGLQAGLDHLTIRS